jgi:hypothetical protein
MALRSAVSFVHAPWSTRLITDEVKASAMMASTASTPITSINVKPSGNAAD